MPNQFSGNSCLIVSDQIRCYPIGYACAEGEARSPGSGELLRKIAPGRLLQNEDKAHTGGNQELYAERERGSDTIYITLIRPPEPYPPPAPRAVPVR